MKLKFYVLLQVSSVKLENFGMKTIGRDTKCSMFILHTYTEAEFMNVNVVEVSGHNLENSYKSWGFQIQCLHYKTVSIFKPLLLKGGGGANQLVEVTVNSKEENSFVSITSKNLASVLQVILCYDLPDPVTPCQSLMCGDDWYPVWIRRYPWWSLIIFILHIPFPPIASFNR